VLQRYLGIDPWLPSPVLVIVVSMLDQWQGGHLLVLKQISRLELNRFGLAPGGKDHRFVLEHLLVDVERCAQQRAKRRQGARLLATRPRSANASGEPKGSQQRQTPGHARR
jgi:hypothetical protein